MLELVDIPTERTTAATDLALSFASLVAAWWIHRTSREGDLDGGWRARLWIALLGLLAAGGLFGAVAHGLVLGPEALRWLWRGVFLSLGWTVALFVAAVIFERFGRGNARRWLPGLLAVGFAFFLVTELIRGSFLVFVAYEAAAMLFALWVALALAFRGRAGATWLAAGISITLIAAAIQATKAFSFTLIWPFDHNGVFHLVQLLALPCFLWALRDFQQTPRRSSE